MAEQCCVPGREHDLRLIHVVGAVVVSEEGEGTAVEENRPLEVNILCVGASDDRSYLQLL